MGTVIDTSVFIAAERGALSLEELLPERAEEQVAISAITASELLHGVYRAQTPGQRARREAWVETILAALPILPFDAVAARVHAGLWAELARRGEPIGAHDLLIAATALSVGFAVGTRDARSFPRVPGLTVHLW